MKITETIERDCCNWNTDLKPYKGELKDKDCRKKPKFCIHCGQIWVYVKHPGEMDGGYEKCKPIDL